MNVPDSANSMPPRVLIAEHEVALRVRELAGIISAEYADSGEIVLVGVLKGAFVFMADLARLLTIPHIVEFIAVSSYGASTASGEVRLLLDVRCRLEGRHVLIVEDIVDTGHTLHYLRDFLSARAPASLATASLLRKPARLEIDVPIEFVGFDIPDVWVVGYGLDLADRFRTLPYIGQLDNDEVRALQSSRPGE